MIDLHDWFQTPSGQHVLAWERTRLDAALADVFGYHALQLGLPEIDALAANRMPYRWLALSVPPAAPRTELVADPAALPFAEASLDLVALPHTLDLSSNPHAALREVRRVLVHEGKVAITGFNPPRLWSLQRRHAHPPLPAGSEPISPSRLRDWLRLLEFEIESIHFGPAAHAPDAPARRGWLERLGTRWGPIFGAVYFVLAVKRTQGARLVGASWKSAPVRGGAPATVAGRLSFPSPACGRGAGERAGRRPVEASSSTAQEQGAAPPGRRAGPLPNPLPQAGEGANP